MKVVIDPGHGGTEEVGGSSPNNATGPTGLLEKTVTLDVARRIKSAANDLDIVLTRSTDTNLGLAARAKVAKDLKAPVFVSVHFNGWPTQEVQGTETYVHASGSADSLGLARTVQAKVLAATGLKDRVVKRAGFAVLAPTSHDTATAACLVEISFMTQAAEEQRLKTSAYLDKLAHAIADAVKAHVAEPVGVRVMAPDELRNLPLVPGDEDAAGTNLGR